MIKLTYFHVNDDETLSKMEEMFETVEEAEDCRDNLIAVYGNRRNKYKFFKLERVK